MTFVCKPFSFVDKLFINEAVAAVVDEDDKQGDDEEAVVVVAVGCGVCKLN
jgi:hypothetical protein